MNGAELTMMYQVFLPNASLFKEVHPVHFITAVTNNWTPSIPAVNNSVEKWFVPLKEIYSQLGWCQQKQRF